MSALLRAARYTYGVIESCLRELGAGARPPRSNHLSCINLIKPPRSAPTARAHLSTAPMPCLKHVSHPPRARRLAAPRFVAPVRARAAAPRLAAARPLATESEVVEVREDGVVVPELVETLEWVLDSPPPLHQFEESPIIVEIAGIEPAASR